MIQFLNLIYKILFNILEILICYTSTQNSIIESNVGSKNFLPNKKETLNFKDLNNWIFLKQCFSSRSSLNSNNPQSFLIFWNRTSKYCSQSFSTNHKYNFILKNITLPTASSNKYSRYFVKSFLISSSISK